MEAPIVQSHGAHAAGADAPGTGSPRPSAGDAPVGSRADRLPRHILLLAAILALAAALRLVGLGSIPGPLSHDEAVKGYDAWSILHTGRDQYGVRFPLVFRAIGDYREAAMPYLIAASEAAFGPTDFAVRLPAALAGIALVLGVYLLGSELFGRPSGLLAALFLAISPWHVQVSRLAFRAGLTPVCITFGLWLLLRALRRGGSLVPAGLVLGLSLHTYLGARAFLPLLLLGVSVTHGRELWRKPRRAAAGLMALFAVAAPLVWWALLHPAGFAGHTGASFGWREAGGPLAFAMQTAHKYAAYLGPGNLVFHGDPYQLPSTARFGLLYWPELLPFAAGLLLLLVRRARSDRLVLWWLLTFPIAPALTDGTPPDWLRSSMGLPVFELITAAGTVWMWPKVSAHVFDPLAARSRRSGLAVKRGVIGLATLALAVNVSVFLYDYAVKFPNRAVWNFNDGIGDAVRLLADVEDSYQAVVLTNDIPAIHDYYLFYSRYDPRLLQTQGLDDRAGEGEWADVRGFGKVRVCAPADCCVSGTVCLVHGRDERLPPPLAEIRNRTGRVAFTIVEGGTVP